MNDFVGYISQKCIKIGHPEPCAELDSVSFRHLCKGRFMNSFNHLEQRLLTLFQLT